MAMAVGPDHLLGCIAPSGQSKRHLRQPRKQEGSIRKTRLIPRAGLAVIQIEIAATGRIGHENVPYGQWQRFPLPINLRG